MTIHKLVQRNNYIADKDQIKWKNEDINANYIL